jgi:hypothetical protein
MSKKYLVVPGYVYSDDGDQHWVSALRLMHLYGVDPRHCVVKYNGLPGQHNDGLIRLGPRSDGKYVIPEE